MQYIRARVENESIKCKLFLPSDLSAALPVLTLPVLSVFDILFGDNDTDMECRVPWGQTVSQCDNSEDTSGGLCEYRCRRWADGRQTSLGEHLRQTSTPMGIPCHPGLSANDPSHVHHRHRTGRPASVNTGHCALDTVHRQHHVPAVRLGLDHSDGQPVLDTDRIRLSRSTSL